MVAGFWNPTNPMHTAPVSIAMALAGHSVGSRYPETAPQTPTATYVQTHTGRGSAWISTGGQLSQRALNSNNPVDGHTPTDCSHLKTPFQEASPGPHEPSGTTVSDFQFFRFAKTRSACPLLPQ